MKILVKREATVNVKLTPREIENEIWEMDSTEQVDLILAMAQRYKRDCGNICMQLQYIEDDFHELLTKEEQKVAIRVFESILDYLKGGD